MKVKECKYCDCSRYHFPYGQDETCHCVGCGAEWEPVEIEYIDDYFDDLE